MDDPTAEGVVWKMAPGASAAWMSPDGRWMLHQRDGLWIARDYSLPTDPREHRRDQERAFYTWTECRAYISAQYQPTSPWVQRAIAGTLPASDRTGTVRA